jgi:peptide/nickel transport system substrate-binding protein
MPGLPSTRPAPDLPAGPRAALVVATSSYEDPELDQLRAPARDADELVEVLANQDIAGFAVTSLINQAEPRIRRAIGAFLANRDSNDLVLVYLSCHGLLDTRGRLYFAAADTAKAQLGSTALESAWVLDQLDECRARRQILILDCCFSGAFARGGKGDMDLQNRLTGQGRGRAVLTASRAGEYSFEGIPLPGQAVAASVFTAALIEGMRTGAADVDGDGYVTLDEAYSYAYDRVQSRGSEQTPQRWLYGAEGTLVLARNPAGISIVPATLPSALRTSLESPYPNVRIGAVNTLAEWLAGADPARVLAAQLALQDVADNDAPVVAAIARAHLRTINLVGAVAPISVREPEPEPAAPLPVPVAGEPEPEPVEPIPIPVVVGSAGTPAEAADIPVTLLGRPPSVSPPTGRRDAPGATAAGHSRHWRRLAPTMAAATMAVVAIGSFVLVSLLGGKPSTPRPGHTAAATSVSVYGSVPPQSGTPHAGTATVAFRPEDTPDWILPIIPSVDNSVYNTNDFISEMYTPLYWTVNGITPAVVDQMSPINPPIWTDGDTTVTFTLKPWNWSNGTAISANDVLFTLDEIKAAVKESPDNWADYTPGSFPDDLLSATASNSNTVVITLRSPVNPEWFEDDILAQISLMPSSWAIDSTGGPTLNYANPVDAAKIFSFLDAAAKSLGSYATNPLWRTVDGPYKLTAFNSATGAFTLAPNPGYGGTHSTIYPTLQGVPYASDEAEFDALKAGKIDVGQVPQDDLAQIPDVEREGYNAFGAPDFGFNAIIYNFKDKTGDFSNIIGQLYIRQALASLEDEQEYIKDYYGGYGTFVYEPIPAAPNSQFTTPGAGMDPYPFSIADAKELLTSHGWNVIANGTDTCANSAECGTGIPKGTKLAFNLISNTSPAYIGEEDKDFATEARQAGIDITLVPSNFTAIIANDNDAVSSANDNAWAMEDFGGFAALTYPTTDGVFNSTGSANLGGYSDPTADELINASVSGSNSDAVESELAYLASQQPCLFQPEPDNIWVWKNTLSGTTDSFESLTQYELEPQLWYLTK